MRYLIFFLSETWYEMFNLEEMLVFNSKNLDYKHMCIM
jgi:hypothetical protein